MASLLAYITCVSNNANYITDFPLCVSISVVRFLVTAWVMRHLLCAYELHWCCDFSFPTSNCFLPWNSKVKVSCSYKLSLFVVASVPIFLVLRSGQRCSISRFENEFLFFPECILFSTEMEEIGNVIFIPLSNNGTGVLKSRQPVCVVFLPIFPSPSYHLSHVRQTGNYDFGVTGNMNLGETHNWCAWPAPFLPLNLQKKANLSLRHSTLEMNCRCQLR